MYAPYRIAATFPVDPWERCPDVIAQDAQKRSVVLAFVAYGLLVGLFPVMIALFALAPAPGEIVWFLTATTQVLLGFYARTHIARARSVDYARAQQLCWTVGPTTLLTMLLGVSVTVVSTAAAVLHFFGYL